MKRWLEEKLIEWKGKARHLPLLLRGARQVGKSYLVDYFGKKYFDSLVTINFEKRPEAIDCFKDLSPDKFLPSLEVLANQPILPGETLLFLDEIQACPRAIMALRYLKEERPELHVIGAGSLLEFAIKHTPDFHMPVGRVQYLFLRPLTFAEYLDATDHKVLLARLAEADLNHPLSEVMHNESMGLLREYLALGGMPEVIREYQESKSFLAAQEYQSIILNTYRDDFPKYAEGAAIKHLQVLFERAPSLIAEQFKYSKVDPNSDPRVIREAFEGLKDAGIVHPVYFSSCSGLPLVAEANMKRFKMLFLDVGLVQRACRVDLRDLFNEDLLLINRGALAEQFVGQELLSLFQPTEPSQLFYWEREKVTSSAEVDFVLPLGSKVVPIEVKAGKTGRLKSLKMMMEEKKLPLGVKISSAPLSFEDNVLSVPFYMIHHLERLTLLR